MILSIPGFGLRRREGRGADKRFGFDQGNQLIEAIQAIAGTPITPVTLRRKANGVGNLGAAAKENRRWSDGHALMQSTGNVEKGVSKWEGKKKEEEGGGRGRMRERSRLLIRAPVQT